MNPTENSHSKTVSDQKQYLCFWWAFEGKSSDVLRQNPVCLSSRAWTIFETLWQKRVFNASCSTDFSTDKKEKNPPPHSWERWSELISERLAQSLCHFLHGGKLVYFPWRTRCVNAHQAVCVSVCILQWLMVSAAKCLTEQYLYGIKAQMSRHNNSNKKRLPLGRVWQWRQKLVYKYIWSCRLIVMLKIHTKKMLTNIKVV